MKYNKKYNKKYIIEIISGYKTLSKLRKDHPSLVNTIYTRKDRFELLSGLKKHAIADEKKFNEKLSTTRESKIEKIIASSKKCKTLAEFIKKFPSEYRNASYYGVYHECTSHLEKYTKHKKPRPSRKVYTKEYIISKSRKFTSLQDLKDFSMHAYKLVTKHNWINEVFGHLSSKEINQLKKQIIANKRNNGTVNRR